MQIYRYSIYKEVHRMALDKTLLAGSSATLVLKLLDGRDMYGYQIIEELACRSNNVFQMKAGTL